MRGLPLGNKKGTLSFGGKTTFFKTSNTLLFEDLIRVTSTLVITNSFPATIINTRIGNRLNTEVRLRKTAGPFGITLSAQDLFKSNMDRYEYRLGELRV